MRDTFSIALVLVETKRKVVENDIIVAWLCIKREDGISVMRSFFQTISMPIADLFHGLSKGFK